MNENAGDSSFSIGFTTKMEFARAFSFKNVMKRIAILDFVTFYIWIRVRMVILVGQQHRDMRLFNSHFVCFTKLELARVRVCF